MCATGVVLALSALAIFIVAFVVSELPVSPAPFDATRAASGCVSDERSTSDGQPRPARPDRVHHWM